MLVTFILLLTILHFHAFILAGYSEGGAMNGEVPSVPITTLAGLASLTHCKYLFLYQVRLRKA